MLTTHTVNLLAKQLAPDVAYELYSDEAWITLCHELIPLIIENKLGPIDPELLSELSLCVMNKISLQVSD